MKFDSRQDRSSGSQSQEFVAESCQSDTAYVSNDQMILVFRNFSTKDLASYDGNLEIQVNISIPSPKPSQREEQLEAKVEFLESQVSECLQILREQNSSLIDQLQEAKSAACWFDTDFSVADYLESIFEEDA